MERFTDTSKAVGVVFDISLRHDVQGNRILDEVKSCLIKTIMECLEDDVDVFYLYHPDVIDPVDKNGLQCYMINTYETNGWKFNIALALKQTLYTLGIQDLDMSKYLIIITDRLQESRSIESVLHLNQKDLIDAKVIVIGIGNLHDKKCLQSLIDDNSISYTKITNMSEIYDTLIKELKDGKQRENICCTLGE